MPPLPTVSADDITGSGISALSVGQLAMQSFQQAQQDARQREADKQRRLEFSQQQEDRQWEISNIRPLKIQAAQMELTRSQVGIESTRATIAKTNAQLVSEALAQRSITEASQNQVNRIGSLGQGLIRYNQARAGVTTSTQPLSAVEPVPADSVSPDEFMRTDAQAPADGSLLPSVEPLPEGGQPISTPAPQAKPLTPEAEQAAWQKEAFQLFDQIEQEKRYIETTTAAGSRERAAAMKSLTDFERMALATPGVAEVMPAWTENKVKKAEQQKVGAAASQIEDMIALYPNQPLNLPDGIQRTGSGFARKDGKPITLQQMEVLKEQIFKPLPVNTYKPDRDTLGAITTAKLYARPDYLASLDDAGKAKAKAEYEAAQARIEVAAQTQPGAAEYLSRIFPATTAKKDAPPPAADKPADAMPEWVSPAERTEKAKAEEKKNAVNAVWTSAKDAISSDIPMNELEGAAAATVRGQKVKTGETETVGYSAMGAGGTAKAPKVGTPARALLVSRGMNPDEEVTIDGKKFKLEQVMERRLEEVAEQKGFKKSGGASGDLPVYRTPAEVKAANLKSGTKFKDGNGVTRVVP